MSMPNYAYLRLAVHAQTSVDAMTVRRVIQDALAQTSGATYANTYVDILWVGHVKDRAQILQHAVVRAGARFVAPPSSSARC
jgi:hypothetical protein